ncbi:MAG: hypothetical protein K2L75_07570 [Muribaculaceae bacterium]|nr:hypothetical protein [Muribaculaceae bacterium]
MSSHSRRNYSKTDDEKPMHHERLSALLRHGCRSPVRQAKNGATTSLSSHSWRNYSKTDVEKTMRHERLSAPLRHGCRSSV